jgi:hypothetical protein
MTPRSWSGVSSTVVKDGILEGDYVLIAFGPTVAQGAIVVAVHNSANVGRGEATLNGCISERMRWSCSQRMLPLPFG